jgi:hypothetical protein
MDQVETEFMAGLIHEWSERERPIQQFEKRL